MKNPVFRLKQFDIDQTGSGMKVNTDGVLLGAIANHSEPKKILEIGTGTGIIALMLAQRFSDSEIDAVEIDSAAADCAELNFKNSPFAPRLTCYSESFQNYFLQSDKLYDLIVCNPPYFIDSLKSEKDQRNISRHTDAAFFSDLVSGLTSHLNHGGICYLILPLEAAAKVIGLCKESSDLHVVKLIAVRSFPHSEPFRNILVLQRLPGIFEEEEFFIYDSPNNYSPTYKSLLREFLTIF